MTLIDYMSRKEGGFFISAEVCVEPSTQGLKKYVEKIKETQIRSAITDKKKELENKNGKKNNSIDISTYKLTRLHTRIHGHG